MEMFSFYNVENLFLPDPKPVHRLDPTRSGLRNWDEKRYRNKLFKISHVFQLMKEENEVLPFLIGLSEVSGRKVLEDLVEMEPFNSEYGIVHYNSMDERKVDVALLYDKTKVEIIDSETITFFFEIINKKNTENYDTTRDVLFSKIKYKGTVINVFVAHLPSKREKDVNKPKRDFILNEIRSRILKIVREEKEHVILCGDFNENPDDGNLVKILYDNDHEKVLINPFQELFYTRNYSTFHYKSGLLYDQIILSKSLFDNDILKFQNAHIFNSEKLSSRVKNFEGRPFRTYAGTRYLGGYSDHFPVFVKFEETKT
ncbi:endonuclease [Chryseobacterium carnipullorum]|uniref:Endonuclease n=1 Tax=Chryseobacterium carnipullorum TaxID=1124835 RepID=A0A376DQX3_CHRCU|nr:endonuclease/exonuclease/phosphatase family protein [Chryseobacterium carnipullorum]AZA48597.1 endonuclease [Chryseobacterium carnipullorum]AZA63517.1 endonuclease [Chryseobacterium carnipullorum]STC92721.1 Endonuclease/Exonuclease/phosphatase family [Chryseobacterium carnipullorum]HBV15948.1 endonuclease [Chryseobacterium carnipullorum]